MIDEAVMERVVAIVSDLPAVLVLLGAAALLIRVATRSAKRLLQVAGVDHLGVSLATGALKVVGWAAALAGAFSVLGLQGAALTVGGTVALVTVGASSALSGILTDFLSGVFLIADREVLAGRQIRTGEVQGRVIAINVRKTKVRDAEGRLHVIPNRSVDGAAYVVWDEAEHP